MFTVPIRGSLQLALYIALLVNMLSIGSRMMIMPMGPDFVLALDMNAAHTGYLSGGATLGAGILAFLLAPFLDRFNRKRALMLALALKSLALAACTLAQSSQSLMVLYIFAGCISGPLGSLLMAAVVDLSPEPQRGRALALVASGFSLAAIAAVPLALSLAGWFGWHSPFWLFSGTAVILLVMIGYLFPDMPASAEQAGNSVHFMQLLRQPLVGLALLTAAMLMLGHSLLIPNFSAYFQFNLDFPRSEIPYLYLAGGLCSLLALRFGGRFIDAGHAVKQAWITSLMIGLASTVGFLMLGAPALYISFMVFMSMSTVRANTVMASTSKVPAAHQRGAYMAYQSTMISFAAAIGSFIGAFYLDTRSDGSLSGFEHLVFINLACLLLVPLLLMRLQRGLAARRATQA